MQIIRSGLDRPVQTLVDNKIFFFNPSFNENILKQYLIRRK